MTEMPKMRESRFIAVVFVSLCTLMTSVTVKAEPRIGDIEVRDGAGAPCFTIPESEERRGGAPNFQAILVTEAGGAHASMWKMTMPKGRTFSLSFTMCVPYGGRLQVLPRSTSLPLQPGKHYDVSISAEPTKAGGPRTYRARFCLGGKAGALTVSSTKPGARRHKGCGVS